MRAEMASAVRELSGSDARVAIVCGNERAFSAGEDVRGMAGLADVSTKRFRSVAREFHDVFDEIEAIEMPVIAAIEGVAAGGGMELALSCDFRVAGAKARLRPARDQRRPDSLDRAAARASSAWSASPKPSRS